MACIRKFLGLAAISACAAFAAPNPNFHIYIAYGQSNMAGNGDIVPSEDQDQYKDKFLMLASHNANASQRSGKTNQSIKTGEWYTAIPPMFHAFENLSPADYFGRAMVDSLPGVTVGIIPVAIGAVSIRAFDKDQYQSYFAGDGKDIMNWGWPKDYDNNPPGRILELAKKAKEVGVIKGFIFHQGESDGTDDNCLQGYYRRARPRRKRGSVCGGRAAAGGQQLLRKQERRHRATQEQLQEVRARLFEGLAGQRQGPVPLWSRGCD